MAKNFSKLPDRDLLAEFRQYNTKTTPTPADYNLTAADATSLDADLDAFETALDD